MGLNLPAPPANGVEVVTAALNDLMGLPPLAEFAAPSGVGMSVAAPQQVYFADIEDVAAGKLLASAEPRAWRYVVMQDDTVIAAAELTNSPPGGQAQFRALQHGPLASSTVAAMEVAERLPEVGGQQFEARLLEVPGLYFIAVWLHGPSDVLIPLSPGSAGMEPLQPLTERAVLQTLQPRAERRLATFAAASGFVSVPEVSRGPST